MPVKAPKMVGKKADKEESHITKVVTKAKKKQSPFTKNVKKKKHRKETFEIYLFRVFNQLNPDLQITKKSMSIMNSFMKDIFELIATEASVLVRKGNAKTMTVRDIRTAVMIVLPGELANHAIMEATKAFTTYNSNKPVVSVRNEFGTSANK